MRAQYHFRRTQRGLLAWDIRRLVELSRDLSRETVPLSRISELNEAYWSHDGERMTCREVVEHARLIAESDLSYPVILSSDGRVMDGMHRICKALLEGRKSVEAVRFSEDPAPDYIDVDPDALPYVDWE